MEVQELMFGVSLFQRAYPSVVSPCFFRNNDGFRTSCNLISYVLIRIIQYSCFVVA
jgi:hypothetical protein